MSNIIAWLLFALGVAHIVFGLVRFRRPLAEAAAAGFIDQFNLSETRRTAFWFVIFGPLLMFAGHVAIHAVASGDLALVRVVGIYASVVSIIGIGAFPKSPFIAALPIALLLVAVGYGWLV
jgi:uncharacterized membrane protein HdeD (DUF308 family)